MQCQTPDRNNSSSSSAKHGESDYEGVVKVDEGFNGADLLNVYTEYGMSVIRTQFDYVKYEPCMKYGVVGSVVLAI
ncbi:hypothetical protein CTI12_AA124220 [Artemisia annua]|uniref:Uncharacterized protein n=1 Tax=Artemisia annua TaxID=35608 RepID=A0A2U1PQM3_ARTAN|nr:hypothetical protein CTI12_AA124220 [Artemisia annua]